MVDFTKVAAHYRQKANNELYMTSPSLWAQDRLNVYLWSKQREFVDAVAKHKKVAIKTCHSIGKSFGSALLMAWWISTRGTDAIVISSAPTYAQVNGILWQELRRFHTSAGLVGRITQDARWQAEISAGNRSTDILVGQGRKPSDTNVSAFQGIHRTGGVLVLLDEAGGVPETLFTGAETITTAPHDRIVAVGNPDDPETEFGRIFREKPDDWHLMTISAFDTPNFTGEWVPEYLKKSLPQPDWVESRRKDWGEESPRYISKVLAQFPDIAEDSLFNRSLVEAAAKSDIEKSDKAAPVMGADIARYGGDRNTLFVRYGDYIEYVDSWTGMDTVETAERIAGHMKRIGCLNIRVDAIGVGAGVVDNLARLMPQAAVYEMVGNAASPNSTKWYNARAYWYDSLRKKIHAGELKIPELDTLIDEFGAIRYEIRGSAMLIESKEDMRKRGVKSPDYLDALVYACADVSGGIEGERVVTEEDLFDDDEYLYDLSLENQVGIRERWSFAPA